MNQLCNAIGSIDLCNGCGAAKLHYQMGCEPCLFNENAKCLSINESFQFRQATADFEKERFWRFFHFVKTNDFYVVRLNGSGVLWPMMILGLFLGTGHKTWKTFLDHAKVEVENVDNFYLVHVVKEEEVAKYEQMYGKEALDITIKTG